MDIGQIADLLREAVGVIIRLASPMLLLSMAVGILLALFQAVTQIHEQTLGFIFKVVVVAMVLLIGGGWMMETILDYARGLFELMLLRS